MTLRNLAIFGLLTASAATAADEPAAGDESETPPSSLKRVWEDWRASGTWRADYFRSSKALDDDTGFLGATFELKALPRLTEDIDGKLEARVTNSSLEGGSDTETRLLEGYARMRFTSADLYLGKQIVVWGRADGINPTDNLTPRDFTVMLPFEDDQRFGTWSARLDTVLSQEHTLTVFASPFFEPSEVPLPIAGVTVIEERPARTLSNTSAGVRLNKVGAGFDWSLSYFRGFSLLPDVRLPGDASENALTLHYNRISVLGADLARNYGRFGLRAEAAYVDTTDDRGTALDVKNPYLHWIAGVDRTFFEYLNVNLQFFQRRVRHHRSSDAIADPVSRSIALTNALIDGQQDSTSNGMSLRVSNKWWHETLEVEIFGVFNFTRDNNFIRPLVTYSLNDQWKVTVGGELYRGAADTQFGLLKRNRGAFAELRYGF